MKLICRLISALWLLPQNSTYGEWPRSGEIDLLESRGNRAYTDHQNQPIGVERFSSTLHFGPRWDQNAWPTSTFSTNSEPGRGFNSDFHKYKLKWTPQSIAFFLDGSQVGNIPVGDGFWKRGNFNGDNLWAYGTKMAPFDQEVSIIGSILIQNKIAKILHFFFSFIVLYHYEFGHWRNKWIFSG